MRWFKQLEFVFGETLTRRLQRLALPKGEGWREDESRSMRRTRDFALEFQARQLLHQLGAEELARKIRVEWNPRLKTVAGRADYREKLISLNPLLRDLDDYHLARSGSCANKLEGNKHSSLTSALHPLLRELVAVSPQTHFECT